MAETSDVPIDMQYQLRPAMLADKLALRELIARSIRELGSDDYTPEQIEAALTGAFGLDTSLIRDQTYFVVVTRTGQIVGCGGWSSARRCAPFPKPRVDALCG